MDKTFAIGGKIVNLSLGTPEYCKSVIDVSVKIDGKPTTAGLTFEGDQRYEAHLAFNLVSETLASLAAEIGSDR